MTWKDFARSVAALGELSSFDDMVDESVFLV